MDTITPEHIEYLLKITNEGITNGARPFGALVIKDRCILASDINRIHEENDITSHAELNCIRQLSKKDGIHALRGTTMLASGQPCPMCQGAMQLAGVKQAFYLNSNADGEPFGLSTEHIRQDLTRPLDEQTVPLRQIPTPEALELYHKWSDSNLTKASSNTA